MLERPNQIHRGLYNRRKYYPYEWSRNKSFNNNWIDTKLKHYVKNRTLEVYFNDHMC